MARYDSEGFKIGSDGYDACQECGEDAGGYRLCDECNQAELKEEERQVAERGMF